MLIKLGTNTLGFVTSTDSRVSNCPEKPVKYEATPQARRGSLTHCTDTDDWIHPMTGHIAHYHWRTVEDSPAIRPNHKPRIATERREHSAPSRETDWDQTQTKVPLVTPQTPAYKPAHTNPTPLQSLYWRMDEEVTFRTPGAPWAPREELPPPNLWTATQEMCTCEKKEGRSSTGYSLSPTPGLTVPLEVSP